MDAHWHHPAAGRVESLNSTKVQLAFAGDVNLRAQIGKLRLKADIETRSLAYILQNQPSLVPYPDFPDNANTTPEIFDQRSGRGPARWCAG